MVWLIQLILASLCHCHPSACKSAHEQSRQVAQMETVMEFALAVLPSWNRLLQISMSFKSWTTEQGCPVRHTCRGRVMCEASEV